MTNIQSPSPRGRLKIFFGYASGVGKTYAMLQAAQELKKQGVDVVAGYISPKAMPETRALLSGLDALCAKPASRRSKNQQEFNLDAAIKRHPKVLLIDELAHANPRNSRHLKRYQDIEELLNLGIDIYTTMDVQQIESLADIVSSICQSPIEERVPDRIFDNADQVKLIDIEPEDLAERFHSGRIFYNAISGPPYQTTDFENLTAFRELALRRMATRISRLTSNTKNASNARFVEEHILVCLSSSPSNARVIRTAARMANAFQGSLSALLVENTASQYISEEDKKRLNENIRLAQQLGAKVEIIQGEDIAFQIAEFSRLSSVTKVVIGRSPSRKRLFFPKPTFSEKLSSLAPSLDIYIIPNQTKERYLEKRRYQRRHPLTAADAGKTAVLLAAVTLIGALFQRMGFSDADIITIYILGVLLNAVWTSARTYSIISSILSVLIFNFFFTVPKLSLKAYDPSYPMTFLVMLLAAFITSSLAVKIKDQAKMSAQTAYRTKVLLETNQFLQSAKNQDEIITVTAKQLIKLFKKTVLFYPVDNGLLGTPKLFPADEKETDASSYLTDTELAVASWVLSNNKRAGATTGTLGDAKCLYLSVRSTSQIFGVVAIALKKEVPDAFDTELLLSMIGESALAMEKDLYARKKEEALSKAKTEQLRSTLLRSISHDLRTPLTSISGNASVLISNSGQMDESKKQSLYTDIYDDSMWLINLVENLLSVTRIEDGTMNIQMQTELLDEVVTEALRHINRKSKEHHIRVESTQDFILAKMDSRLIIQVIINLVDNAIKYTQEGSEIVVSMSQEENTAVVRVADNGPGIPDEAKGKLFEMFYTANNTVPDSRRGMGLGLAVCRSVIHAHGGSISVKDNVPRGTVFEFTLHAEEVPFHE